jgi:hypothetical protein
MGAWTPAGAAMTTWTQHVGIVCLSAALAAVAGCAAQERTRPVRMGPVDTGAGSLEAVRRQFEGTWAIDRLEVPDAKGTLVPVNAKGGMKMDAFGNLEVRGTLDGPLPGGVSAPGVQLIEYGGRLVIDVQKSVFRLMAPEASAPIDKALLARLDPKLERKYGFLEPGLLRVSTIGPSGAPTIVTTFRKVG